jgi:hypothetical protein
MKADERLMRAYLEVLETVALFVRMRSRGEGRLSDEHLFDIMDAIHNIPAFLRGDNDYFTPELMREYELGDYDAKWSENGGLHLVRILDEALSQTH